MVTQFDEKGKIFTQVVNKQPIKVNIQTTHHLIHGLIHIRPDSRLKDELSGQERFLALTEVTIFNHQNEVMFRSHFMIINIDEIIWLIPEDEMIR